MLDYIFFDARLSNKFKDHLTKVGIEFEVEDDENFGSVQGEIVSIADETKDDVLDELQVLYDELQEELEQILEQNGDGLICLVCVGFSPQLNLQSPNQ
jgi:hypothetical protein